MAVLKHIKSRNADYSKAIEYLLFQHNEDTGKPILDEQGRLLMREEYYIDGLNCDPMSFDTECEQLNAAFHKNQKWDEIKSHHYVISFDPKDKDECHLTGKQAQTLCLEFAKKYFPGYQALVVTHTDGHSGSGNIHTHIVINSLRKETVRREEYMDQPNDHVAGYKHRQTKKLLRYLQKNLMEMCEQEGLHQVDLLTPAPVKITNEEYWAKRRGQKKLNQTNQKIIAAGMKPKKTVYQTQKQYLRDAIDDVSATATSFEEFQKLLLEKYKISVTDKRGRFSYLHPDRTQPITERALGTKYGRTELINKFVIKLKELSSENAPANDWDKRPQVDYDPTYDYHADPIAIIFVKSDLRLVTDLQTCIKAQQSRAYARKVEISNLQEMAKTVVYIQENGYDTRQNLQSRLYEIESKYDSSKEDLASINSEIKALKDEIHFTKQYLATKRIYDQMLKSKNKKKFRTEHQSDITAYEKARSHLQNINQGNRFASLQALTKQLENLQNQQKTLKQNVKYYKDYLTELEIISSNVDAILEQPPARKQTKTREEELS